MSSRKSTGRKRARKGGRPKMDADLITTRRVTLRIYGEDEDALTRIKSVCKVDESEAVRRALRAYAAVV